MFSDRFEALCREKGVKPGRACQEMGVSRSLAAKWKATGTERPSADVLEKMSAYFGITIDEILGKESAMGIGFDDFTYAMQNETFYDQFALAHSLNGNFEISMLVEKFNGRLPELLKGSLCQQ